MGKKKRRTYVKLEYINHYIACMNKLAVAIFLVVGISAIQPATAQYEAIRQEGEFGISAGVAHYFGDLNTRARVNRPKLAVGAFFRKQFGNYIGLRVAAHFAQLGYSDVYNKQNDYQRKRNLSFNSNIFELALQGDFNFFKFVPGDPDHSFTPYVTLGIGVFSYDPYAFLNNQKIFLRPLGTEGQGHPDFPDRKPYNTMAICLPLGVGVKYALNDRMNIGLEITHRFTNTDYLDDVSKTYIGEDRFPLMPDGSYSQARLLQDRSYETSPERIGLPGVQRGFEKQKDQYIFAEVTFSFNLTSYRCPTAN